MLRLAILLTLIASIVRADPNIWKSEWPRTDFSTNEIGAWSEIRSGGPPKDGIPAINDPDFLSVSSPSGLDGREPVITLELPGETSRAYPIRYLIWHEIINDVVGDVPVAVTFCPLCNSGIVFDRRVNGEVREFGVTGKLRNSDMIMFDRETESWWQQATGTGIVGHHTSDQLTTLPAWIESWDAFRARHSKGLVMKEPDWRRAYGQNPYVGYDSARRPLLYNGEDPPHGIAPLARVVRVENRSWPLARLAEVGEINEAGVTLSWSQGTASALDTRQIGRGRDVGSVRVRNAAGENVSHDVMFAFAFHAFWPDGIWMLD